MTHQRPSIVGAPLVLPVCEHTGLTTRGFWAGIPAIDAVFLGRGLELLPAGPRPVPGPPFVAAAVTVTIGLALLVAGLCGMYAARGRPLTSDQDHQ